MAASLELRSAATAVCAARLYDSYDASIEMLLSEIAATSAGDRIAVGLYLLEGGTSSERVLAALESAGVERGVRVSFGLDVSYVSMISRLTEKTDTLIPRVTALAVEQPSWCSVTYQFKPDHGKYALFLRQDASASSAILGGMNLGDRFRAWRDFTVRLPADAVDDLCRCLWGGSATPQASAAGIPSSRHGCDTAALDAAAAPPSYTASDDATRAAVTGVVASAVIGWLLVPASLLGPVFALFTHGESAPLNGGAALAAAALATGLGIATDARRFSLPRELSNLGRALVFDRSKLGDALAPLRYLIGGGSGAEATSESTGGAVPLLDRRYNNLPPLTASVPAAATPAAEIRFTAATPATGQAPAAGPQAAVPQATAATQAAATPATETRFTAAAPAAAMISIPPRDTSPHQDSTSTAPSDTPPPAQPPPPPQSRGTAATLACRETSSPGVAAARSCNTGGVSFFANRRASSRYEIEPAFRSLFSDTRFRHYRVVMAYLGPRWGVEMIEIALRRGASVELLLPAKVKRSTTDREQHLRHTHTHDKKNTPNPQTNTPHTLNNAQRWREGETKRARTHVRTHTRTHARTHTHAHMNIYEYMYSG